MGAWECPTCSYVKEVICPVCGTEKEAGATCSSCGSEYSHTSCPQCNSAIWHEPPLEIGPYMERLKEILKEREQKYLTYYELMRMCAVYAPSSLKKVCLNDPIDVKNLSQEAFSLKGEDAEKTLLSLQGMSMVLAQMILLVLEEAKR